MKKTLIAAMLAGLALSACGGGDSSTSTASGPAIRLTYSGVPLGATQRARAMAASADVSSAASVPGASNGDAQATIAALQEAFKARGAEIGVYPGVIDGTALHQLVMAEGNGVGPTADEIAKANVNISEWVLVNFALDDMTGYIDTEEKDAKFTQFIKDMRIYAGREYLKGRVVFAALPNVSCAPI